MNRVWLLSAALADIEAARQWYEAQRPGLGDEFVEAVDDAMESVLAFPAAYPVAGLGANSNWTFATMVTCITFWAAVRRARVLRRRVTPLSPLIMWVIIASRVGRVCLATPTPSRRVSPGLCTAHPYCSPLLLPLRVPLPP